MTFCGYPKSTGSPCKLPAGWGTAHKGAGRCRHHEDSTPPVAERVPAGRIIHPENTYAIRDGLTYQMPPIVPAGVAARGADAMTEWIGTPVRGLSQRSTYRYQFDAPNRGMGDGQVYIPYDDPLCEWDAATREHISREVHAAFQRNPFARQAVMVVRQFAVGTGHSVTAQNQDVQAVIDAFRANEENAVYEYDKTFLQDLLIDGELFIRKFPGGGDPSESVIVPLRPWLCYQIDTAPGFFRRVERYHFRRGAGDILELAGVLDEYEPDEMLHIAINRHSYELRGRSDLYSLLPWLRAYKAWLEDRGRQNQWRGALVFDVAVDGDVSAAQSRYSTPPTPGSIIVHHAKETWKAMTNPVGAGDAAEDGRQMKLMIAVGAGLPEYMLSDGQNANLASATAQELPALWKFIDAQQIMAEQVWTPIYKWVVQQAVDAELLPEMVEVQDSDGDVMPESEPIKAVDAFSVEFPALMEDDPKTLAEALQIAVINEWVSNQTASSKMGFDFAQERKRIQREKEQERDEMAQGTRQPPLMPPGADGPPDEDDDGPDTETTPAER